MAAAQTVPALRIGIRARASCPAVIGAGFFGGFSMDGRRAAGRVSSREIAMLLM
jgi:hypothetical protein